MNIGTQSITYVNSNSQSIIYVNIGTQSITNVNINSQSIIYVNIGTQSITNVNINFQSIIYVNIGTRSITNVNINSQSIITWILVLNISTKWILVLNWILKLQLTVLNRSAIVIDLLLSFCFLIFFWYRSFYQRLSQISSFSSQSTNYVNIGTQSIT